MGEPRGVVVPGGGAWSALDTRSKLCALTIEDQEANRYPNKSRKVALRSLVMFTLSDCKD